MGNLDGACTREEMIAIGVTLDVCMTPLGPLKVPVPYIVVTNFADGVSTAPKVRFNSKLSFTHTSHLPQCEGAEPGLHGGIVSGVNQGSCRAITGSAKVNAHSGHIVHHLSLFWMNCADPKGVGNSIGIVLFTQYESSPPLQGPVTDATLGGGSETNGGAESAAEPEPDSTWRFTYPLFAYPTGKRDVFGTVSHFDTGWAPLNFGLNAVYSLSNVCTMPFNALSRSWATGEDGLRLAGFGEGDIQAINLMLMNPSSMAYQVGPAWNSFLQVRSLGRAAQAAEVERRALAIMAQKPVWLAEGAEVFLATNPGFKFSVGHNMVGIRIAGQDTIYWVEQAAGFTDSTGAARMIEVIRGGQPTRIVMREKEFSKYYNVVSTQISGENAAHFMGSMEALSGLETAGPYSLAWNSCTTVGRELLCAAGMEPAWWARTPTLLEWWFRK